MKWSHACTSLYNHRESSIGKCVLLVTQIPWAVLQLMMWFAEMVHVSCTIQGKRKYNHLYMYIAVAFLKISTFVKTRFKNTSNRGRFKVEKIRWVFQLHQLQLLLLWDGWVCGTGLRSPAPTYHLAAAAILVDPGTCECRLLTSSEYTEWKMADKSMSLIPAEGLLVISERVSVGSESKFECDTSWGCHVQHGDYSS